MLNSCFRPATRMRSNTDPFPCNVVDRCPIAKRESAIDGFSNVAKVPSKVIDESTELVLSLLGEQYIDNSHTVNCALFSKQGRN